MDNANFHKRTDMLGAIEKAGVVLEFLLLYSPGLNQIENKRTQAKAMRKRERSRAAALFAEYIDYDKL